MTTQTSPGGGAREASQPPGAPTPDLAALEALVARFPGELTLAADVGWWTLAIDSAPELAGTISTRNPQELHRFAQAWLEFRTRQRGRQ